MRRWIKGVRWRLARAIAPVAIIVDPFEEKPEAKVVVIMRTEGRDLLVELDRSHLKVYREFVDATAFGERSKTYLTGIRKVRFAGSYGFPARTAGQGSKPPSRPTASFGVRSVEPSGS